MELTALWLQIWIFLDLAHLHGYLLPDALIQLMRGIYLRRIHLLLANGYLRLLK